MKFLDKLILACVMLFVMVTVNVATAETLKQQQAKQFGLNQASPNQMALNKLGTELMVKTGSKAVLATYVFSSATGSGTVTFKEKGTNTAMKIPACSLVEYTIMSFPTAATSATAGTLITLNSVSGGDLGVDVALADEIAANTNQGAKVLPPPSSPFYIPCSATSTGLTGTISGTVSAGSQIDLLIKYIPYNQTP